MKAMLKMKVVNNLDGYLGLPIPIGKKKYNAVKRSTVGLRGFCLMGSIPTYVFSVFLAPKGVLEEIQSMISRVWWSGGENKRGWNMMAWD
ncbi:caffeic acid 3-O-methyltransferase-like [Gossypium australe]|uniref:Caffeic acid 3-O-methyltransferase-like n=1 Tax=Gossypium australe TaxID=47621 RepID=A0A5B6WHI0_9ROSI|nr:caffeic acid 3-O-methyltransferase-like [Gossypium australe]